MRSLLLIWGIALFALCRCAFHDKPSATNDATRSFATLQTTIISAKCSSCHSGASAAGGIDLSTYEKIMKSGTVVPGNPDSSSFYLSVARGSMPPGASLAASDVTRIRDWIASGAENNIALRIDSLSPSSGSSGRQTSVTILGQGFANGALVKFGDQEATSVTVVSSTKITCLSPAKASGRDDVAVINFDGSRVTSRAAFSYGVGGGESGLSITRVFPTSGPSRSLLEVTGSGISENTTVTVGGQRCVIYQVTPPTMISCTLPERAESGAVDVVLAQPSGESALLVRGFFYTVSASFTSLMVNTFQPKCARCHGASNPAAGVALNSYANILSSAIIVPRDPDNSPLYQSVATHRMPSSAAPLSEPEITEIKNWIKNGAVDDTPPQVTSISPTIGAVQGGTAVRIGGTRFVPGASVIIGDSACTPVTVNPSRTEIQCVTSAYSRDSATVVDVVVVNPAVAGMASLRSTGGSQIYTYQPAPTITSVSPASRPSSSLDPITLTGKNFLSSPRIEFGNLLGSSVGVPVCDANRVCSITVTPPIQPPGLVNVKLTNRDGQFVVVTDGLSYTEGQPPVVTSIDKAFSYNNISKTVTILGQNFLPGAIARIGGNALRSQTRVSLTEIRGVVDPDDLLGEQTVTVTNADRLTSTSTSVKHTILQGIAISAINPNRGSVAGNTIVTITGVGFRDGASADLKTLVTVGGVPCTTLQFNSDSQLVCITPRTDSARDVRFEVKNPPDPEAFTPSASVNFTYTSP